MTVNRYAPHLYVIPEDDANRQIAIGFEKDFRIRARSLQIVAPAGGWLKAIEKLQSDYFAILERNPRCHVLVLIDCDQDPDRIANALAELPESLRERVFVLGTLVEPESLRASMKLTYETIGEQIANDCFEEVMNTWSHPELKHNQSEVARLKHALFSSVFMA